MIYIVCTSDLTRYSGDSIRIAALSSGLSRHLDETVNLVFPVRYKDEKSTILSEFNSKRLNLIGIPVKCDVTSRIGFANSLIVIHQYLKTIHFKNSLIQVEGSIVGGILASLGFKGHIVDIHGLYFEELVHNYPQSFISLPYKQLTYCIEKRSVESAKTILTPSRYMKNFLVTTCKINRNSIHVIYNGFSKDLVKATKEKEEEGMITFVGGLAKWACVGKIIEAARFLRDYDVHFYIVGDGPDKPRIAHLIKQHGLENVTLAGRVPIREAHKYIARSQIVLSPFPKAAALDFACPIKLLEYMAFGKAILVDNVGEIPSMLQKKDAALVSDPLSGEDFIDKLRLLINDKNLRRKISQNARNLAKDFTWDKQSVRLAEVYRN